MAVWVSPRDRGGLLIRDARDSVIEDGVNDILALAGSWSLRGVNRAETAALGQSLICGASRIVRAARLLLPLLSSSSLAGTIPPAGREAVRLYESFGFVVTSEADIIGVHCWFMLREPNKPQPMPEAADIVEHP